MIKKKITKNINTKVSPFQFEISQIIVGIIGFAAALGIYFLFRDYTAKLPLHPIWKLYKAPSTAASTLLKLR